MRGERARQIIANKVHHTPRCPRARNAPRRPWRDSSAPLVDTARSFLLRIILIRDSTRGGAQLGAGQGAHHGGLGPALAELNSSRENPSVHFRIGATLQTASPSASRTTPETKFGPMTRISTRLLCHLTGGASHAISSAADARSWRPLRRQCHVSTGLAGASRQ